jgi:hypothetical protein
MMPLQWARLVDEKVLAADAGIIERDIKVSEVLNRPVEGGAEVLGFGDITATERGAATLRAGHLDRLPAAVLIDIGDDDLRPTFGQRNNCSSPDAGSAAADDGHLAFNLHWLLTPKPHAGQNRVHRVDDRAQRRTPLLFL